MVAKLSPSIQEKHESVHGGLSPAHEHNQATNHRLMPEFWFSKFVLEIGVFLRRRVAFDKNSYHQLERESTLRPVGHWTGSGSLSHAAWGDYSTKVKLRVDWILHHHPTTTTTLV